MDDYMDEYVRQKISTLREKRGWTEWQLGEESGISQSTISAWYAKKRAPNISSLSKVCDAFGITICQFFSDEGMGAALTEEQNELFEIWITLIKPQRKKLLEFIKSLK
jgi:transcriptional regulator with XRE-family HTH domain